MKKILFLSFISVIFLSGCFHKTENNTTEISEEVKTGIVDIDETGEENVYEINMTAKKFEFDPHTIILNKGEKVVLNITSTDVEHGFSLPAFNIDEKLPAGETVKIEFTADKVGEFEFECSVFCGFGHKDMKGKIIVE